MRVSLNYKIPQEKVINFNWNDEKCPSDQKLIASIQDDFNNNIYHFYKNDKYISIFIQKDDITYKKYYPMITLPLQAIAWILKTRYRFTLPSSAGGITEARMGFQYLVKDEHIGMVVGVDSWTLFNYSRPSVNDYDDRWCQSIDFNFELWRQKRFQQLLHALATAYPLKEGDVELLQPSDYFNPENADIYYDYINAHLPNIQDSL